MVFVCETQLREAFINAYRKVEEQPLINTSKKTTRGGSWGAPIIKTVTF